MRTCRPLAFAAALVLAGCSSTATWNPRTWFSKDETPAPKSRELPGVDARLRPVNNSAVSGTVRMRESGDLLIVFVDLQTGVPGPYRVVLHANGNCSSPNGFSAGAPWSPPGWKDPATRLVPEITANLNGAGQLTARIRGARLGDAVSRSVLVYQGTTPQIPQPDVRNNAVACGVFEQATRLF